MNTLKDTYIYISTKTRNNGPSSREGNRILVQNILTIGRKYQSTLIDNQGQIRFNNLKNIWDLKILLSNRDNNNQLELLQSSLIIKRLAEYLRNKNEYDRKYNKIAWGISPNRNTIDCVDFCYMLKWRNKDNDLIRPTIPEDITFEQVREHWKIKKWDIVCIQNKEDKDNANGSYHASIYLWEWLFLSKLWPMHDIAITDLESLKVLYNANQISIILLNSEYKERFW